MEYREKNEKGEVLAFLHKEKLAVLSTHASDGTIDASAIFYVIDENFDFYFTTKEETRKFQNLMANPNVSLTITDVEGLKTVQVKGAASVVTDEKEVADRITGLINKHKVEGVPWAQPIAKLEAGQYAIIRVTPSWLRYGVFKNEVPKGEYFKQII